MKTHVFGKQTSGTKQLLTHILPFVGDFEYLGERVDLSNMIVAKDNLIIISNQTLLDLDINKTLAYISKDTTKPLMVVNRVRTFGTVFFMPNFEVEKITTNKAYNFSGVLYIPRTYLDKIGYNNITISKILREVPYEDWRFYIINYNKKQ